MWWQDHGTYCGENVLLGLHHLLNETNKYKFGINHSKNTVDTTRILPWDLYHIWWSTKLEHSKSKSEIPNHISCDSSWNTFVRQRIYETSPKLYVLQCRCTYTPCSVMSLSLSTGARASCLVCVLSHSAYIYCLLRTSMARLRIRLSSLIPFSTTPPSSTERSKVMSRRHLKVTLKLLCE